MEHELECLCKECWKNPSSWHGEKWTARRTKEVANLDRMKSIMKIIGLSYSEGHIDLQIQASNLCELFLDDKKCEELIVKLKNKAFW